MEDSITNLLGKTLTVGQRVTHYDGWTGVVSKICHKRGHVYVNPDNVGDVPRYQCWPLSSENAKRAGKQEFCKPRDHGLSMGNYIEACED